MTPLVDLLKRVCGLRVWFDGAEGNAAMRSSELLAGAIGNARGALFCLSEAWKRSSWCKNEYEVSLSEQRMHAGFEIVCLRLDDVDPPGWFNVAEIIDLRNRARRRSRGCCARWPRTCRIASTTPRTSTWPPPGAAPRRSRARPSKRSAAPAGAWWATLRT